MAPAHQGLQAEDVAGLQAQPWLVVEFQFVTAQGAAQLALQNGLAAGAAIGAFVEDMEGAALAGLGLLHGDVGMPHQRIGALAGAGVGDPQAAAQQQAFAVHLVGLGQGFGDAFGDALGPG
ncbi:hypothetical protein D3C84_313950 [compost metagenome]